MPNTYTQIHIHVVFAVKGRRSLISESHRERIERYMCGIISAKKSKPLAIYCNPDHCHILIGLHPAQSISDLVRDLKSSTAKWINQNMLLGAHFEWQDGFGAFSHSKNQLGTIISYIQSQPEHHYKKSFRDEYIDLLNEHDIEFDPKYIFNFENL